MAILSPETTLHDKLEAIRRTHEREILGPPEDEIPFPVYKALGLTHQESTWDFNHFREAAGDVEGFL